MAAKMDNGNPNDHHNLWGAITVLNSAKANKNIADVFHEEIISLETVIDLDDLFAAVIFNALPIIAIKELQNNGGNALGIEESDGILTIVNLTGSLEYSWLGKHSR